jgi:hypothetical protein
MKTRTLKHGAVLLASAVLTSACATGYAQNASTAVYGASLAAPIDDMTRDLIRTYVRDTIGPDYIVDLETLTRSNTLRAVDRGRGQVSGRPIPVPDVTFLLELAETFDGPVCRLVPQGGDLMGAAATLILPPEVACQLLPTVI